MITITVADGFAERALLGQLKTRSSEVDRKVTAAVSEIIYNVQLNGDGAIAEYTLQFDGALPPKTELGPFEMETALKNTDPDLVYSMQKAAENITAFHERQRQQSWLTTEDNGAILGQRVRGLERVGIYVPGGTAAYPSSVLMNAIPAKIAGVKEIVMVTPPGRGGTPNSDILAAAAIAGVDRVFLVGGAQAVAGLAFGTETIPKVDKIVGPGNIYVATAKRLLYGTVDIDMVAGPSEILIVADASADPACLAADLMSQAEHDELASAILLTDSLETAQATVREIDKQIAAMPRRDIIEKSLRDYGAVIVLGTLAEAVDLANELAAEHVEICTQNPLEYIGMIDNAGSVFLGHYSPECLGDYYAGPNHVLPTGGTARFFSPLSVDSFVKKSSFIYYTRAALEEARDHVAEIARAEGLFAHENSLQARFR
ncbi:MAG TPA: histidinol dehydrogenase [Clostridiales bacterium]|nr:MAG: Histidinol dehydrogenase [Firmicutes bacterium ADurb.Bin262]HOU11258.1 histidinol dehydrogenase [Clostridiales bacterium]HQK73536.1 histidinol dehydrogenase [Clostridiales bacterium]